MITEVEKAYFAGIFDGEGTIGICHSNKHRKSRQLQIAVGQTIKGYPVLRRLEEKFGGGIYPGIRCKRWCINGKKAGDFLALVLPYMLIKRDEAELALEFERERLTRGYRRLGPADICMQERYEVMMKRLKLKGVPDGVRDTEDTAGTD